jgi:large subunit ribosomal protein L11
MKVPVKIIVDVETKAFEVEVGTPTTSALIVKELGIEKGSGSPKAQKVGSLSMEQVVKIALMKKSSSYAKTLKAAVKEILGACVSMGVLVENRDPLEIKREIDEAKWDSVIKED